MSKLSCNKTFVTYVEYEEVFYGEYLKVNETVKNP